MPVTARWQIAIETALVMFTCSAGIGAAQLYRHHVSSAAYVMIVGVPAFATALYVALSCLATSLISLERIQFPLTFTLPFVFCSLLPVSALLLSTPERGLVALQESVRYAHLWQQPVELAVVLLAEFLAMSLLTLISGHSERT